MNIDLLPHNQAAYDAAVALMEGEGRAAVIHPTGTGKSFIAFKLAEECPGASFAWLAPSGHIWRMQLENVGRARGVPPEGRQGQFPNITFLTYSKLASDGGILGGPAPDYIILDEFHRCGAAKWGEGVRRLLGSCPGAKVLGLSATNIRYLDSRRDMAEELFGGLVASEMTLGEAVAGGILPAPKYVSAIYSYQGEYRRLERKVGAGNPAARRHNGELLEKLRRALEDAGGMDGVFERNIPDRAGKYIIFCSTKGHMEEVRGHVGEWFGGIDREPHVYTVHYGDPGAGATLDRFRQDAGGHLKLLFCINMLNEGIHVGGLDGVVLLRPTISPVLYLQQVGRCLAAGGEGCPVIFDIVNNFEALRCVDFLRQEAEEAGMGLPCARGEGVPFRGTFQVVDEARECRRVFEELRRSLTASWGDYCRAAAEYRRAHGDLRIPKGYVTPTGLALGAWLRTQKYVHAGRIPGRQTPGQAAELEALGIDWGIRERKPWEEGLAELEAYYRAHGDIDISVRYVAPDGYRLGGWLDRTRQMRRVPGGLTQGQVEKLDGMGMSWGKGSPTWEEYYAAAEAYRAGHGDLEVPRRYATAGGLKLGIWVSTQRRVRQGSVPGNLTPAQVSALDGLGMRWGAKAPGAWAEGYGALREYHAEHGNADVKAGYVTQGGFPLGRWVSSLRSAKKKGALGLAPEQAAQLDALGMVWDKPGQGWEAYFKSVEAYHAEHGGLDIPKGYTDGEGRDLYRWLAAQRRKYLGKGGGKPLTPGQAARLESLGMAWEPRDMLWEAKLGLARRYYEANGDLDVPSKYRVDGVDLGRWIRSVRAARQGKGYAHMRLTPERVRALDELGMDWG